MDLNKLLKSQWDRVAAIALSALGAIFLLVGWIGVSGSAYLAAQAPYILSGGVGGIFFLGLGATLWISADLRDEWRKLDRIEAALGDGTLRWAEDSDVLGRADHMATDPLWDEAELPQRVASVNGSGPSRTSGVAAKTAATPRRTSAARNRPRTSGVARES